ncbi:hypothetical protein W822_04230 [Advenella kashmirensis W13003]|uniref:Uncharacterized protein n=1 Tax=Advenella kashmirensis W13003 TaxID=1424334 RepID=V8QZ99_9BURK|nr:hypothetical protein W822_04230 [Advenella kashmirensis W13003]
MRINGKNSISSYEYSVGNDSVDLTVKAHNTEGVTYAAYLLFADGTVIEKKWYKANGHFIFTNILPGDYKFRIYVLREDKKVSFLSTGFTVAQSSKELDDILAGINVSENLRKLLSKPISFFHFAFRKMRSAIFYSKVRSAIHGSIQINEITRREVCLEALTLCRAGGLLSHQFKFLMDCITYVSDIGFLEQNRVELLTLIANNQFIHPRDSIFWEGTIEYKVGNYFSAQIAFQSLLPLRNSLEHHQTGSISYFYRWDPETEYHEPKNINIVKMGTGDSAGVVLMSCDYGYFMSYFEKTISKLLANEIIVHIHLILPANVDVETLSGLNHERIGVSYEYESEDLNRNKKTYYSVARYLVCSSIIKGYGKPVLISDIDIDFQTNITSLFSKIEPNEIALIFSRHNLPWLRIMAGFNLFGAETADSEFLTYISRFLRYCVNTGRDGWTLDQTALDLSYRATRDVVSIKNLNSLKKFSVRQYSSRAAYRKKARHAIDTIKTADAD